VRYAHSQLARRLSPTLALMGILWFGAGSLFTFVVASAASVYLADHVERAWGRGGSFQVLCVLALVATFLLLIGFGVGAAIRRRFPLPKQAAMMGSVAAAMFMFVMWLASEARADPGASWMLILALPLFGALTVLLLPRHDG
jgi:hypothetical protein